MLIRILTTMRAITDIYIYIYYIFLFILWVTIVVYVPIFGWLETCKLGQALFCFRQVRILETLSPVAWYPYLGLQLNRSACFPLKLWQCFAQADKPTDHKLANTFAQTQTQTQTNKHTHTHALTRTPINRITNAQYRHPNIQTLKPMNHYHTNTNTNTHTNP